MADPLPLPLNPLPFEVDPSRSRLSRENTHILTKFPKNFIYNCTVPLSFETYPEIIYTIFLFVNITTPIFIALTPIL